MVTARPASSLPWAAPTTTTFLFARGLPMRRARIGRPSADCPIVSVDAGITGARAVIAIAAVASTRRSMARVAAVPRGGYGRHDGPAPRAERPEEVG